MGKYFYKVSLPKDKFQLPLGWLWQRDWEIAPEQSLLLGADANHTDFIDEIYEQHYRSLPGATLSLFSSDKSPYLWADYVKK